jgi:hypothetical protein
MRNLAAVVHEFMVNEVVRTAAIAVDDVFFTQLKGRGTS